MRTKRDRIRHTLGFEVIGLLIFAPLASWAFGYDVHSMGVIAIAASVVATVWNYFYNLWFDQAMLKLRQSVHKTLPIRILHAVLFEGGLLLMFLPLVAWYLNISLLEAFIMDIAMALFYVVYAFIYNYAYDKVFPIAQTQ